MVVAGVGVRVACWRLDGSRKKNLIFVLRKKDTGSLQRADGSTYSFPILLSSSVGFQIPYPTKNNVRSRLRRIIFNCLAIGMQTVLYPCYRYRYRR
jgi:hypothetical protein